MRERAQWDIFVRNVSSFCEQKKELDPSMRTGIITLIDYKDRKSTEWMSAEFRAMLGMVDEYELRYAHNWAGEVDTGMKKPLAGKQYKIGCGLLMHTMVVLPNGDVTVCCSDLNSRGVIGNITRNSLYEIYRSPLRLNLMRLLATGKKHESDLCKDCESY